MIHHSAVSYEKNSDQFEANNNYHKEKWNFKSSLGFYLGYNYEISKKGIVRQARKDGEVTAACYQGDMNNGQCIHICLDGNFDEEKPMPEQVYALRDLMRALIKKYTIEKILFHNEYAPKTCPGKNIEKKFIESLAPIVVAVNPVSDKQKIINQIIELLNKL
jgi:N-acetyl-anhydromuramyl-L-alanine amidase AmpD